MSGGTTPGKVNPTPHPTHCPGAPNMLPSRNRREGVMGVALDFLLCSGAGLWWGCRLAAGHSCPCPALPTPPTPLGPALAPQLGSLSPYSKAHHFSLVLCAGPLSPGTSLAR